MTGAESAAGGATGGEDTHAGGAAGREDAHTSATTIAKIDVPTAEAMRDLGHRLAEVVRAGDLIVLTGALGAGKTTLTQGIGVGMDVRGPITSPTFVIARVHPSLGGGPSLVHADAYRLGGVAEIDDLDLDTSIDEAVTVVEWGAGMVEELSEDRLEVVISRGTGDARTVSLVGVGRRWTAAVDQVAGAGRDGVDRVGQPRTDSPPNRADRLGS